MQFTGRTIGWMCVGWLVFWAEGRAEPDAAKADDVAITRAADPTPALHEALVRAIQARRLLHFTYGGQSRVVEPHAYGVSASGEVVLHGYQVAGGSNSVPPPGWRTFTVANIDGLVEARTGFSGARRDYSGERLKLDPTWAELTVKTEE
jgi:hypothetical protein